jgi:cyclophilin family peptidyl-prolyl cis-trans isomerase
MGHCARQNRRALDDRHSVFGELVEGMDTLRAIGKVPTNGKAGGKLPMGKRGSGSPFWSFSAAVR